MFKREGKSMLIVPLTIYKNYVFDIVNWDKNVNFNEVFADYLTGSYKNLKLDISKKIKITIMEKRSQDFTYDL